MARDERLSTGGTAFNYQFRIPTKLVRRRCHVGCHASQVCVDRGDRRQVRQTSLNNRKFVAGLALCRLCLRRAALHGPEIQVEQRLLFVSLVLVLLAQA